jgi:signal transduction histidine kinase
MRIRAEELIKNQERGSLPVSTADDEISNLARTLNQLLEALHASLSQQSQLIADVSHELRTPLAVLQSRLQLAINSEERLEQKLELAKMLESSMSLTNMLNQILFLARNSPSANNQISTAPEMRELFFNTIDSMRLLASKRSIVIEGSVEVEYSAQISIDGLERILNNLIANSLASVEAGGTITVDLSQTELVTKLVVRDSGVGFPPEFIPKALERFSRADSSRSRQTGGFGLGLSLVKAILDSCDGDIEIENLPEKQGAKISLTLKNVTVSPHRN